MVSVPRARRQDGSEYDAGGRRAEAALQRIAAGVARAVLRGVAGSAISGAGENFPALHLAGIEVSGCGRIDRSWNCFTLRAVTSVVREFRHLRGQRYVR